MEELARSQIDLQRNAGGVSGGMRTCLIGMVSMNLEPSENLAGGTLVRCNKTGHGITNT